MKSIELTKQKIALVDDEDFERVNAFNWYASNESRGTKWYAIRWSRSSGKKKKVRMSHFVLNVTPEKLDGLVVDHINHDSLDNRKCNLEIITQSENMRRSKGWNKKIEDPFL